MPSATFWRYDPESNMFQTMRPDGIESQPLESISNGQIAFDPGSYSVYDPGNPFNRYQQGRDDLVYVQYANGNGELTSLLQGVPRNLFTTEMATYGLTGEITVRMPDGSEQSVNIQASDLMGAGKHVYTYIGDDGQQYFFTGAPGDPATEARLDAAGYTAREATGDEIKTWAVQSYLANNEQELLAEYTGTHPRDRGDAARQKRYDAAYQIAQVTDYAGLGFFKSHLVGFV